MPIFDFVCSRCGAVRQLKFEGGSFGDTIICMCGGTMDKVGLAAEQPPPADPRIDGDVARGLSFDRV